MITNRECSIYTKMTLSEFLTSLYENIDVSRLTKNELCIVIEDLSRDDPTVAVHFRQLQLKIALIALAEKRGFHLDEQFFKGDDMNAKRDFLMGLM